MDEKQVLNRLYEAIDIEAALRAFKQLAPLSEAERRRLLRPHWEGPILTRSETQLRDRTDNALDFLALLELAVEVGAITIETATAQIRPEWQSLLASPAVASFIDDYDYFGVRFLLSRIQLKDFPLPALKAPPALPAAAANLDAFLDLEQELRESGKASEDFLSLLDDRVIYADEQTYFRAWLEGEDWPWPDYLPSRSEAEKRFARLRDGGLSWFVRKAAFYAQLDGPTQARFAVYDVYWLGRIFSAEIRQSGEVRNIDKPWIESLIAGFPENPSELNQNLRRFIKTEIGVRDRSRRDEQVRLGKLYYQFGKEHPGTHSLEAALQLAHGRLRGAFARACNWIQGTPLDEAAPVAADSQDAFVRWDAVSRTERSRIAQLRRERFLPEDSEDLCGLAFSGGGIRSATFNLGVLEALRKLDLLRHFDYLSSVSGGGYIGAWLIANCKRKQFWIKREADWNNAIRHLRRFSNYLSPKVGLLSADTWSMAAIWIRNTLLVQLLVTLFISLCLMVPRIAHFVYAWWSTSPGGFTIWIPYILLSFGVAGVALNLLNIPRLSKWPRIPRYGQSSAQSLIVIPMMLSAFLIAATLWSQSGKEPFSAWADYSDIFIGALYHWILPLAFMIICIGLLSISALRRFDVSAVSIAIGATVVSSILLYSELCGIMKLFHHFRTGSPREYLQAFLVGPPFILFAFIFAVVLQIGFLGENSRENKREWWGRLGAWLGIYGFGWLLAASAAYLGPLVIPTLKSLKWPAIGGWAVTTLSGILAGCSSSTNGDKSSSISGRVLDIVAKVAPTVFIAGVFIFIAHVIHALLVLNVCDQNCGDNFWAELSIIEKSPEAILGLALAVAAILAICAWRFDINIFSLNCFYRNRLVRCYLGASRGDDRDPQPFTQFDTEDDFPVHELFKPDEKLGELQYTGPYPIINCAVNLGSTSELDLHTRHSASFFITPDYIGSQRPQSDKILFAKLDPQMSSGRLPLLGQAIAVSGAAANPNMGYHTSSSVAFLMTLFNVRLGWWFANPRENAGGGLSPGFSLWYLIKELFGSAGEDSRFVNVSDGGHFENLALYELIRRRCRVIIACDAECDKKLAFGSLGNLIRIAYVDFGARVKIDVSDIHPDKDRDNTSRRSFAIGTIEYCDGSRGVLIYLKSSLTGSEDESIQQYKASHADFPHETTGDQFFSEDQFESYRWLGHHIAMEALSSLQGTPNLPAAAELLSMKTGSSRGLAP
ncbi:MAG: patatin-like phospholipase family protein [Acidobacteria bacterium]|nr:patatin-like phospholipase family protein [Acidobacteriota bacterium]